MTQILRHWSALAAAAATLGFSSCTYDPYYSSSGGYYDSGYGYGYGYGGSNFSTSLFVSTGDPRWGYDPYSYCYYDYRSRRYYDPYLYGYYPVGYRPPVVIGVPHPYGWRPGRGYCPPPRQVRNVTVVNYRNREAAYRSSKYSWANQVRIKPSSRVQSQRQTRDYSAPTRYNRKPASPWSTNNSRQRSENSAPTRSYRGDQPQRSTQYTRQQESRDRSSNYNTAVTNSSQRRAATTPQRSANRNQSSQNSQPMPQNRAKNNERQTGPAGNRRGERQKFTENSKFDESNN